ncbi:MAG: hypothetical protein ACR2QL_13270 [Woeseiaceae bacterium]
MSDRPTWQQQVRPRLAVSMVLATLLVAIVLLLLKIPQPAPKDSVEIDVRLLEQETAEQDNALIEEIIVAETLRPESRATEDVVADVVPESDPAQSVDWQEQISTAAEATVAASHSDASLHPGIAEAKRLAAINFAPSRAPVKRPIWENVEQDQMGRTVLRNGDCYRVLDDWRATYQDIQRDLGQYIMYCDGAEEVVIDVKWVEDIRQNYAYLRHKDGEIPASELDGLLRRPAVVAQE